jgi:hypothetical protein
VQGTTGAGGATGPSGATGPAGSAGTAQYGYVYNLAAQNLPLQADVAFDTNGLMTAGITHVAGSTVLVLVNAGTYQVTYSVSGTQITQMALFVDGDLVLGSDYGSGAGTQQNTGQAIVTVAGGAVLTLRNHTSAAAVDLPVRIAGTQDTANASVLIVKLG